MAPFDPTRGPRNQLEELHDRARRRFGRDLWLLGSESFLGSIETFIHRTAGLELPILLSGEHGTGRRDTALALHLASGRPEDRFVELEGSSLGADLSEYARASVAATGGTLYLAEVDSLPPPVQMCLAARLREGSSERNGGSGTRARVVASTSTPIGGALFDELAFFELSFRPLRDRAEDVVPLALHFLRSYGSPVPRLPAFLQALVLRYTWPGNIPELRRVMARLAAASTGGEIREGDVRAYAPELTGGPAVEQALHPPLSPSRLARRLRQTGEEPTLQEIAHPCLRRGLQVILKRVSEPLSLAVIADAAHVSPSHLSYLFKHHLGTAPMAFVTELRVAMAETLLVEHPDLTVSQTAERVGFSDLRTLERAFKKHVHVSPRTFRRSFASNGLGT